MSRPVIVVDCDPGHDDAVAIALAAHTCELLAITTVAGNVGLANTTKNALALVQLLALDAVPVHSGAAGPLAGPAIDAVAVHGASGLAGAVMPVVTRAVAGIDAPEFLVDAARANPGLWIVATGPLTNLALAMQHDPNFAARIAGISIMGGGTFGNVTAAAEFNIYADPEAADLVLRSGARIVMCGLDLTHQVLVDDAFVERCASMPNRFGPFAAGFLGEYLATIRRLTGMDADAALHDPCAVLALTRPEYFEFVSRSVVVETAGEHTRGMTLVDQRAWMSSGNVSWARRIDAPAALSMISEAIAAAP
jgi:inosine-uridine nucleoside N-ribohydrolase